MGPRGAPLITLQITYVNAFLKLHHHGGAILKKHLQVLFIYFQKVIYYCSSKIFTGSSSDVIMMTPFEFLNLYGVWLQAPRTSKMK